MPSGGALGLHLKFAFTGKFMDQHDLTAQQFGSTARHYLTSTVHAAGQDLERLTRLAAGSRAAQVLDLGCGAGHASFALARGDAERVIAYDLSPEMLAVVTAEAQSREHRQIETHKGPAERLAFADSSFDMVVTRYSAHHWFNVPDALREAGRVLKSGGILVVIDVIAPETALMDTVLQTVELLRDTSHVRDYRESEWRRMLGEAKFSVAQVERWKILMEFASWTARIGTSPERIDSLRNVFDSLPSEARDYFAVTPDRSFAIDSCWLESTKD
jgi:ubiquinone/menaquinone biosynthesis C-methylase UbiE